MQFKKYLAKMLDINWTLKISYNSDFKFYEITFYILLEKKKKKLRGGTQISNFKLMWFVWQ